MSRQSVMPARNLTLTEELEKLEQSITLVLQEIDHNFSRAHRIVSGSIIPIVEQYAKHSDSVWEGSKFWKQFFEASANVSLSSYEEAPEEDFTLTDTAEGQDEQRATPSDPAQHDASINATKQRSSSRFQDDLDDLSIVESPSVTVAQHGTPRAQHNPAARPSDHSETSFADYSSPYENLKEEMGDGKRSNADRSTVPSTPGRRSANTTQTPQNQSSPAIPLSTAQQQPLRQQNNDPLLHRVLDKNYRIGTTPHATRKKPTSSQAPSATATATRDTKTLSRNNPALDSSPFSPAMAAPELRSEIFGSPSRGPRTPGVSVQHNKGKTPLASSRKALFTAQRQQGQENTYTGTGPSTWNDKLWDSDSDTNDDFGMSPPKTMQFHVPQSRLMQTPAKEASRRIVEDLLLTAGAASVTSTLDDLDIGEGNNDGRGRYGMDDEDSPSIVRMAQRDQDEEDF